MNSHSTNPQSPLQAARGSVKVTVTKGVTMKHVDKALLSTLHQTWHYVGQSSRTTTRFGGDEHANRPALRRLIALGYVEVRTVTISHWLSEPRVTPRRKGPYVEARLTAQGLDVRRAQRPAEHFDA